MSAQDHPLLAAARELERRDAELATQIEELTQLEMEIASLRADAARVARLRDELPALRDRAANELRGAEAELERRQAAVRAADEALATAADRDAAERALATAETARADGEARLARARAELEQIERDETAAEDDAGRVAEWARTLARGNLGEDVDQWAARARAAVFAQRTHAEGERAQVQTEASELASAVTGEALVGDVPRVRRAVEAALARQGRGG